MEKGQIVFLAILMIASVFLFAAVIDWCAARVARNRRMPERSSKAGVSTALVFSFFLLLSIWLMRFAVGYYAILVPEEGKESLTAWEEITNSFLGALRTFSMEEEYAEYIVDIKALIAEIVPADHRYFAVIRDGMVAYASLLNLIAPIVGGAIILEILASIFPKIRLRCSYLAFRRPKYFFSELNPASMALAKSIHAMEKKALLVFTDTHIDDEKEKEYELLLEAKQYGAICIRDDLVHVAKPRFGKREFYLMDENEFGNLQTLMGLTEDHNIRFVRNAKIYLFVQSDAYVQLEKQVNQKLEEKKALLKGGEKPVIVPVNGLRNLVHNLLVDVPLYEPMVCRQEDPKLKVTILGNGTIGTEAFLSAYWFGQFMVSHGNDMTECDLTVNVVSKDTKEDFWAKIGYVNPEIKDTVEIEGTVEAIGKTEKSDAANYLVCDGQGTKNKPYCKVRYIPSDVKIGKFWEEKKGAAKELLDSDYFIVALGNDADNISVAGRIRRAIGKHRLEAEKATKNKTVIAYAVFDSQLADTLNGHKRYQTRDPKETDIYMHAFGSLDQVYSYDNVNMSRSRVWAEETGAVYDQNLESRCHTADNRERAENGENGNYNYWANIARASHVKYKVFSLGWIKQSVFDDTSDVVVKEKKPVSADELHREQIRRVCEAYKRIAIANRIPADDEKGQQAREELEKKKHCLAWLEHRRWNAFTRTLGYRYVEADTIFPMRNSQKDMSLKLHACLVEAKCPCLAKGDSYIHAEFKANGKVDTRTMIRNFGDRRLDRLDEVSHARRKRDESKTSDDFKLYDYYRYEFYDYLSLAEASALLNIEEKKLTVACKKKVYAGAILFEDHNEWYIPFTSLEKEIGARYRKITAREAAQNENALELFGNWYVKK